MVEEPDIDDLPDRDRYAEQALTASEARYCALVDAMADGVITRNPKGIITSVNPAAARILGVDTGDLLGRSILDSETFLDDNAKVLTEADLPWSVTRRSGTAQVDVPLCVRQAGERTLWLSINTTPLDDEEPGPHAVITTFRDITAHRRTQHELQMLQTALDGVADCAYLMEQDRILQVNQGACRSLGYSKAELVGMSVFAIDPKLNPERFASIVQSAAGSEHLLFESSHRARDGRIFPVEVEISPFTFDGRRLAMVITRDITERRKAADAMRQLNRTLLTLSAGNEALVRANSEPELFERMCRILVETGGHRIVWIDVKGGDDRGELVPAAVASIDGKIPLDAGRAPRGRALAAALASAEPQLIEDIHFDELSTVCRADLLKAGCRAGLVLPLVASRGMIGMLSIFAETTEAFDRAERDLLRELADDLAYGIQAQRSHTERQQAVDRLRKTMEATIVALANTLELRDPYTAGHQRRVALLARAIAGRLGLDPERIEAIYLAGMIHDIGKIYVPSEVLNRPGKLTPLEYSLVQTHVEATYSILDPIDFPWPLAEIVYQHHERLDGSGYPRGMRGDEIMLDARILAVADVVEAMSAHRPYRPGQGIEAALAEIESGKDHHFDPIVVDACIALFGEGTFAFE